MVSDGHDFGGGVDLNVAGFNLVHNDFLVRSVNPGLGDGGRCVGGPCFVGNDLGGFDFPDEFVVSVPSDFSADHLNGWFRGWEWRARMVDPGPVEGGQRGDQNEDEKDPSDTTYGVPICHVRDIVADGFPFAQKPLLQLVFAMKTPTPNRRRWPIVILVWGLAMGIAGATVGEMDYLPNQVIVQLKSAPSSILSQSVIGGFESMMPSAAIADIRPLRSSTPGLSAQSVEVAASSHYLIRFVATQNIEAIVRQLLKNPQVARAQPNYKYYFNGVPNDPHYPKQYVTETSGANIVSPVKAQLEAAWGVTHGDPGVLVGVMDTGVAWLHPDLAVNIWRNPSETENGKDDDGNGLVDDVRGWDFVGALALTPTPDNDPQDRSWHGTHVAGILGAVAGNAVGIAGVGFNCKIVPLKVADDNGEFGTTAAIVNAISYGLSKNVRIFNMSFGGRLVDFLFESAVKNAIQAGAVVVAAAGNQTAEDPERNLDYTDATTKKMIPASYPGVVCVSSTDNSLKLAETSKIGVSVVVAAPGDVVLSTYFQESGVPSEYAYAYAGGTSQAAPFVSGVIALMWSVSPNASASSVVARLIASAHKTTAANRTVEFGYGIAWPYEAIRQLNRSVPVLTHTPPTMLNTGVLSTLMATTVSDIVSYAFPVATLHYWFTTPSTEKTVVMTKNGNQQAAGILPPTSATLFNYYIVVKDLQPTHSVRLPAMGFFSVPLEDRLAPSIDFVGTLKFDFMSKKRIEVKIIDNVGVDSKSIHLDIVGTSGTRSFSVEDTEVKWDGATFSVDLSGMALSGPGNVVITARASDLKGNAASASTTFKIGESLSIFGPQGPDTPVLNAPNPFDPSHQLTRIQYQLTVDSDVTWTIYSMGYRPVIRTVIGTQMAGYHEITWDGNDDGGSPLPNGVYFGVIHAVADGVHRRANVKMAVLR